MGASGEQLPSTDNVAVKMIERDNRRQAALHGYTAIRRYTLENSAHHKRAEMLVRVNCLNDGSKQFQTISAVGGVQRGATCSGGSLKVNAKHPFPACGSGRALLHKTTHLK